MPEHRWVQTGSGFYQTKSFICLLDTSWVEFKSCTKNGSNVFKMCLDCTRLHYLKLMIINFPGNIAQAPPPSQQGVASIATLDPTFFRLWHRPERMWRFGAVSQARFVPQLGARAGRRWDCNCRLMLVLYSTVFPSTSIFCKKLTGEGGGGQEVFSEKSAQSYSEKAPSQGQVTAATGACGIGLIYSLPST